MQRVIVLRANAAGNTYMQERESIFCFCFFRLYFFSAKGTRERKGVGGVKRGTGEEQPRQGEGPGAVGESPEERRRKRWGRDSRRGKRRKPDGYFEVHTVKGSR